MTGSGCENLPSPPVPHTDCVFRVQTHGHQTLQKESKKKNSMSQIVQTLLICTNHCKTNLTTSTVAWQATMKEIITATEQNRTVVQPLALPVSTFECFLLEEPPIADCE